MKLDLNIKNYFTFVIFPIVFIIVAMLFYSLDYLENKVVSAKHELMGLEEIADLQLIVVDLQQLRGISNIARPGERLRKKKEALKRAVLAKSRFYQQEHSGHMLCKIPQKETQTLFRDIAAADENRLLTPEQRFLFFSGLIDNAFYIMKQIAYHTGLTFDDDAASFFLVDNLTVQIPQFIEYNGKLRGISLGLSDKEHKVQDMQFLHNQLDKMQERLGALKYNIRTITENIDDGALLRKRYQDVLKAHTEFVGFIHESVIAGEAQGVGNEEIFDVSTAYIARLVDLYRLNKELLTARFEEKIARERYNQYFLLGGGLILLLLILYSHLKYYRINKEYIKIINTSNRQLELMSITDALTGLYNRRYFDKLFTRSLRQTRRDKTGMAFIMADIDCFKEYNDTYGHHFGDNALCEVAKVFKESLHRPGDYAFRLGGEEFGVILMDMTEGSAEEFATRLCRSVEERAIEHRNNCCSDYITVSMGMIYIDGTNTLSEEAIYKEADDALYCAKKLGKNRVKIYAPERYRIALEAQSHSDTEQK